MTASLINNYFFSLPPIDWSSDLILSVLCKYPFEFPESGKLVFYILVITRRVWER